MLDLNSDFERWAQGQIRDYLGGDMSSLKTIGLFSDPKDPSKEYFAYAISYEDDMPTEVKTLNKIVYCHDLETGEKEELLEIEGIQKALFIKIKNDLAN